jgi:hypothetical protein
MQLKNGLAVTSVFVTLGFLGWRAYASEELRSSLFPLSLEGNHTLPFDLTLDPKLGMKSPVKFPEQNANNAAPTLVVFAGSCSSCSLVSFDPEQLESSQYGRIIVIYESQPDKLPARLPGSTATYIAVADPVGKLAKKLNASWSPRYYLFSAEGNLINIQKDPAIAPSFVHRKELK